MQDELVKVIQERTGLDEGMAQQIASAVIEFVKTKLPPELAPMLDGDFSDAGELLGGLLGGRGQ